MDSPKVLLGGFEAIESLINDGLRLLHVRIVKGGKQLRESSSVSEEELLATRADLKVLLYEMAETATSQLEARVALIEFSISEEVKQIALPLDREEMVQLLSDDDSLISILAQLMHCELVTMPLTVDAAVKKNVESMTELPFSVMAGGLLFKLDEADMEKSFGEVLKALLRIEDAIEGRSDLHCPQCGKNLKMAAHLCAECAKPSKTETVDLEGRLLNGRVEDEDAALHTGEHPPS